jgi:YL1 nuclear protein C-terminal domain.
MSGTEVKYFDPSNGIPYSSVETYKLLKSIEQGLIPWLSIGSDVDDIGSVEIYLGSRDSVRHANGVPEGFDS